MTATLLLAVGVLGQARNAGSFEFRNQTRDQTVTIWIWSRDRRVWANNQRPVVLRPNQSVRVDLSIGKYHLSLKSQFNSTLVLDRELVPGHVDRLRFGEPGGTRQMRIFTVRDDYGNYTEAEAPPMTLPG
jgi:hypothetical protein